MLASSLLMRLISASLLLPKGKGHNLSWKNNNERVLFGGKKKKIQALVYDTLLNHCA